MELYAQRNREAKERLRLLAEEQAKEEPRKKVETEMKAAEQVVYLYCIVSTCYHVLTVHIYRRRSGLKHWSWKKGGKRSYSQPRSGRNGI